MCILNFIHELSSIKSFTLKFQVRDGREYFLTDVEILSTNGNSVNIDGRPTYNIIGG